MTEPILRKLVLAIEGYTENPDIQIVSFNQRENGDYEVVVRDMRKEKTETADENNKQA